MLGLGREQRSPPRRPLRAPPTWGWPCTRLPEQQLACRPQHSKDKYVHTGQDSGAAQSGGVVRAKGQRGLPCAQPEGSVSRRPGPLFKPARVGRRSLSTSFWCFQENGLRSPKEATGRQKLCSEMGTQKKPLYRPSLST